MVRFVAWNLGLALVLSCGTDGPERTPHPCTPSCLGLECGDDGCGGSCGSCGPGATCEQGRCVCRPKAGLGCCGDSVCWIDSCGNTEEVLVSCPKGCVAGRCADCEARCEGLLCGAGPCGDWCGDCRKGASCIAGKCVCAPDAHRTCCGETTVCTVDSCGDVGEVVQTCPVRCFLGACSDCNPTCAGRECGQDGCGVSCGTCQGGKVCEEGRCVCKPKASSYCCGNAVCFKDSCGGDNGKEICPSGCKDGKCVCEPACDGRECGPDGCGGTCGNCAANAWCSSSGLCVSCPAPLPTCVKACQGPADCATPGLPPGGSYGAGNWTCKDNGCAWKGCASDAACAVDLGRPAICLPASCGLRTCAQTCVSPADCATAGPLTGEKHWTCAAGTCRYLGCLADADCKEAFAALPEGSRYECRNGMGVGTCTLPCKTVNDCVPQTPTLITDADNWACKDGFCAYKGCNSTAECLGAFPGSPAAYQCAKTPYGG